MPVKRHPDYWIIAITLVLLLTGIVMIFSSSAVLAAEKYNDSYYFLKRQIVFALIGVAAMVYFMRIDYRNLARYSYLIYAAVIISLVIVLIPGIGHSVNGAQRWIRLGAVTWQPAEFAKLGLVIFFAGFLTKKMNSGKIENFSFGFIPCMAALGVVALLIQLQPDLGTSLMIGLVVFCMFIVAGMRLSYIFGASVFIIPFLVVTVYNVEYRRRRILSFLDPWEDFSDSGYQIIQSFVALSRGGVSGTGLGAGQQKLFYLPEPHTDFIFAIIGEELGFIGAMLIIILFAIFTWRGLRVGLNAPDRFGSLLAIGITLAIGLQAIINISVTLGMAPTKGLPLPLISLGGSALIMWLISIGLLLNVSEHTK